MRVLFLIGATLVFVGVEIAFGMLHCG